MHCIDGDIAGRVAAADHQHPFAGEDIRALVGIRMQQLSAEITG